MKFSLSTMILTVAVGALSISHVIRFRSKQELVRIASDGGGTYCKASWNLILADDLENKELEYDWQGEVILDVIRQYRARESFDLLVSTGTLERSRVNSLFTRSMNYLNCKDESDFMLVLANRGETYEDYLAPRGKEYQEFWEYLKAGFAKGEVGE